MRSRWSRLLVTVLGVLVAVMAPAAPASAEPPHVQDHYDDVFDVLLPTPDDEEETFCGLVDVPLHGEVHGYFSIKNQGNSDFPYFADHFRGTFVYTNPTTGLTFSVVVVGNFRDLHVVDNGDNTLTITNQFTGIQRVYGPDGELLFTDRGLIRETFMVDNMGTIDPDDDVEIGHVGEPFIARPHETFGRDFCADFLEFTAA